MKSKRVGSPRNPVFDWSRAHSKRAELTQVLVDNWAPVVNEAIVNGRSYADLAPCDRLSEQIHLDALAMLRGYMAAAGVLETAEPVRQVIGLEIGWRVSFDPEPMRPEEAEDNVIWLADRIKAPRAPEGGTCA